MTITVEIDITRTILVEVELTAGCKGQRDAYGQQIEPDMATTGEIIQVIKQDIWDLSIDEEEKAIEKALQETENT